ncbi:MAG TPA: MarR family transcriptional regulator [Alphaproteobacteria bacterium]|nr:MarR family transcriptional regulator [Alphaproteobacteria bacterium]
MAGYVLEAQIGFVLRKAQQRATAIFARHLGRHQLTPTQWTTLVRIEQYGSLSQNHLGRLTAMDPATIQGVVKRLIERKLVTRMADPDDRRRKRLGLTKTGQRLVRRLVANAFKVSRDTLRPLAKREQALVLALLERLG